jgi:hypothetical protein
LVDRWIVLVITQFISGTIGILWGYVAGNWLFVMVGGFFFSLGIFAATMWGYNRWKAKSEKARLRQKRRH